MASSSTFSFARTAALLLSAISYVSAQGGPGGSYIQGSGASGSEAYQMADDYTAQNFFDKFIFYNSYDPTYGHVQYVDKATALQNGYASTTPQGTARIQPDLTGLWPTGGLGRPSVRIISTNTYYHGLFIFDLNHMPTGCGTWPAYWLLGPNWPYTGEVDIIEGVNTSENNTVSLHTSPGCTIAGSGQTTTLETNNCDSNLNGNSGCGSQFVGSTAPPNNYGSNFNGNNGGVYATEWTSDYIKTWFFPRGSIPQSITTGAPDVSTFGTPSVNMQGSCDIDSHFSNMSVIINIDFCGAWAGEVYSGSFPNCPQNASRSRSLDSCTDFVGNNPTMLTEAYFDINYLRIYQMPEAVATTSSYSTSLTSVPPNPSTNTIPIGQGTTQIPTSSVPYTGPLSSTAPSSLPTATSSSCPSFNNTIYTDANNQPYSIYCGFDYGGPASPVQDASSFETCMELCDRTAGCWGVSYSGSTCYVKPTGYTLTASEGTNAAIRQNGVTPAGAASSSAIQAASSSSARPSPSSSSAAPPSSSAAAPSSTPQAMSSSMATSVVPSSYVAPSSAAMSSSAVMSSSVATSTVSVPSYTTANVAPIGTCGASSDGYNCYGAPDGNCCSEYGFCGSGDGYCGAGCQSGYGDCDPAPTTSSMNPAMSSSWAAEMSSSQSSEVAGMSSSRAAMSSSSAAMASSAEMMTSSLTPPEPVSSSAPAYSSAMMSSSMPADITSSMASVPSPSYSTIPAASAKCPSSDGTYIQDECGVTYILSCGNDTMSGSLAGPTVKNLDACLQACSSGAYGACSAFTYDTRSKPPICYIKNAANEGFAYPNTALVAAVQVEYYGTDTPTPSSVSRSCAVPTSSVASRSSAPAVSSMAPVVQTSTSVWVSSGVTFTSDVAVTTMMPVSITPSSTEEASSSVEVTAAPSTPANCDSSFDGTYELETLSTNPAVGAYAYLFSLNLNGGILTDSSTGYTLFIAGNGQLQAAQTPPASARFPNGWYSCSDGNLGISQSEIFYACAGNSGVFLTAQNAQCVAVNIRNIGRPGAQQTTTAITVSGVSTSMYTSAGQTWTSVVGGVTSTSLGVVSSSMPAGASSWSVPPVYTSVASSAAPSAASSAPAVSSAASSSRAMSSGSPVQSSAPVSSAAPSATAPACPTSTAALCSGGGSVCSSEQGATYNVTCGIAFVGTVIPDSAIVFPPVTRVSNSTKVKRVTEPDFGSCQALCDYNSPRCVAVNYIGTNCTLLSEVTGQQYVAGAVTAVQVPVNEPACPGVGGTTYTDTNSTRYTLTCYTDYAGNDIGTPIYEAVFSDCLPYCDALGGCAGVVYDTSTHECYLKSALTGAQSGNNNRLVAVRLNASSNSVPPTYGGGETTTTSLPPGATVTETPTTTLVTTLPTSGSLTSVVSGTTTSSYLVITTTSSSSLPEQTGACSSICFDCAVTPILTPCGQSSTVPSTVLPTITPSANPNCPKLVPSGTGTTVVFTTYTVTQCGPQPICPNPGFLIGGGGSATGSALPNGAVVITTKASNGSPITYTHIPTGGSGGSGSGGTGGTGTGGTGGNGSGGTGGTGTGGDGGSGNGGTGGSGTGGSGGSGGGGGGSGGTGTGGSGGGGGGGPTVTQSGGATVTGGTTALPTCPYSNGQVYTDIYGEQYVVQCDTAYSDPTLSTLTQSRLADCISACGQYNIANLASTQCQGVSYIQDATSDNCLLKSDTTEAMMTGTHSARLVSRATTPGNNGGGFGIGTSIGPGVTVTYGGGAGTGAGTGPGTGYGTLPNPTAAGTDMSFRSQDLESIANQCSGPGTGLVVTAIPTTVVVGGSTVISTYAITSGGSTVIATSTFISGGSTIVQTAYATVTVGGGGGSGVGGRSGGGGTGVGGGAGTGPGTGAGTGYGTGLGTGAGTGPGPTQYVPSTLYVPTTATVTTTTLSLRVSVNVDYSTLISTQVSTYVSNGISYTTDYIISTVISREISLIAGPTVTQSNVVTKTEGSGYVTVTAPPVTVISYVYPSSTSSTSTCRTTSTNYLSPGESPVTLGVPTSGAIQSNIINGKRWIAQHTALPRF